MNFFFSPSFPHFIIAQINLMKMDAAKVTFKEEVNLDEILPHNRRHNWFTACEIEEMKEEY